VAERREVSLRDVDVDVDVDIEVFLGEPRPGPVVCAAHPADRFDAGTVELLAGMADARVICVNPLGLGGPDTSRALPLEQMVARIEEVRRRLGIDRWIFWGMSGGGWLAQIYGYRYPESLAGIVIESACLCFRERLADPACVLSPFFPAWREPLLAAGLLAERSPAEAGMGDDTEWLAVDGIGEVFRRREGPALLVSPGPLSPEMKHVMPRLWEFDARPRIREVRVPGLVLCGAADPVVPVHHARAVHEALAGSSFEEIAGASHVPTAERRPEVTAAFQRFLRLLPKGGSA
jgi:proline iminopeptidase